MEISRRDFLKTSTSVSGLFLLGRPALAELIQSPEAASPRPNEKAMLYDASKCIGCYACMNACRREHKLSSGVAYTEIKSIKLESGATSFLKHQCLHCTEATCVKVCPTKALTRHELGFVMYNQDKCIGCGYCAEFCPFHVPSLSGEKITGAEKMSKCDFCADRVINNRPTACVEACPVHALTFGSRADLIAQGKERAGELIKTYPNARFYGENELVGLHVMYVLKDSPEAYGLPINPEVPAAAIAWQDVIQPLGWAVGGLTLIGLGLNYLVAREAKMTRELPGKQEEQNARRS
jgi:formate dehydrogenase iron-sulfur subunit